MEVVTVLVGALVAVNTNWELPLIRVAAENIFVWNSRDVKKGTGKVKEEN